MSVSRATHRLRRPLAAVLVAPVAFYRRFVSPALPARCKYHPSCSAYAVQAIRELGPLRGPIVAAWRLARCNPWSNGGYDPLSERRLFRSASSSDGPSRAAST